MCERTDGRTDAPAAISEKRNMKLNRVLDKRVGPQKKMRGNVTASVADKRFGAN